MRRVRYRTGCAVVNLPVRPAELTHPGLRQTLLLRDAGFDVHAVTRGETAERIEENGISVWIEAGNLAAARRVATLAPELLFVESSTYGTVLAELARRSWIRNPRRASRRRVRCLQQSALTRFDAVSFTNPAEAALWRVGNERALDLPYPVDVRWWGEQTARRDSWWTERGWAVPDGPVIVCNSAFERHKRHEELLRGLTPMLRANRAVVLVLFGHRWVDPDVWQMVNTLPGMLGIADQVRVTDWISYEEIRELLAWATLTVINSQRETQCLAVYEALAAGVPTLISAIPELVSQFPHLLAHLDGDQMLANAERVLSDPGLGQHLVEASRERVMWADVTRHDEQFRNEVERLLGRPFGSPRH